MPSRNVPRTTLSGRHLDSNRECAVLPEAHRIAAIKSDDVATWKAGQVMQMTTNRVFEACLTMDKKICLVAFLPRMWDNGASRERHLIMLREVATQESLRVVWAEGGEQLDLEFAFRLPTVSSLATHYPAAVLMAVQEDGKVTATLAPAGGIQTGVPFKVSFLFIWCHIVPARSELCMLA